MSEIAPSILACDFNCLGAQIKAVGEAGIKYLHVDVMDGDFVPSISFGMPVLESVRKGTKLFLDTHLMIREPSRYVEEFRRCGADLITVHFEACGNLEATLEKVRASGAKAGLSINPETDVTAVIKYLPMIDLILVMSVHPGFGGQKFMPEAFEKLRTLRNEIDKGKLNVKLEVDGGVHLENIGEVSRAGADIIVCGTAVFNGDIKRNIKELSSRMQNSI